jgi:hypothetical protein
MTANCGSSSDKTSTTASSISLTQVGNTASQIHMDVFDEPKFVENGMNDPINPVCLNKLITAIGQYPFCLYARLLS